MLQTQTVEANTLALIKTLMSNRKLEIGTPTFLSKVNRYQNLQSFLCLSI